MSAGKLFDIDRLKVCGPEFQHFGPQQEGARVAGYISQLFESQQTAARGGGGHARTAGDVTETEGGMVTAEGADDGETLGEPAHRFAADD